VFTGQTGIMVHGPTPLGASTLAHQPLGLPPPTLNVWLRHWGDYCTTFDILNAFAGVMLTKVFLLLAACASLCNGRGRALPIKLNTCFISSFPLVRLSRKHTKDKKWMSADVTISSKTKNKLFRKWMRSRSPRDELRYKSCRKVFKRSLR